MKQTILLIPLLFMWVNSLSAQSSNELYDPKFGVKTNLLYDATTTINLGAEIALGRKTTIDLSGNYNDWSFSGGKMFKHWLVQPEFRFWFCRRMSGHFLGIHGFYGQFNSSGIKMLSTQNLLKEGSAIGGGLTYGYQWIIGKRWNLEAALGLGYAYLDYKNYDCKNCGRFLKHSYENYLGPTKVAISLIYLIK